MKTLFTLLITLCLPALAADRFIATETSSAPTFEDTFATDLAAGSVNGTYSTGRGTPQVRTVADGVGKIKILSGKLYITGDGASYNNNYIVYPSAARVSGRVFNASLRLNAATASYFAEDSAGGIGTSSANGFSIPGTANYFNPSIPLNTDLIFNIAIRSAGSFIFAKTNDLNIMMYAYGTSTANVAPKISQYSSTTNSVGFVRIPKTLWLPTPIASDSFSVAGTTDGLGHPEKNGGSGLVWKTGSNATWSNIGGTNIQNSPTTGSELVQNGDMSSSTGWTGFGAGGWSIGSGIATHAAGTAAGIYQSGKLTIGNYYQLQFLATNRVAGYVGDYYGNMALVSADGFYTQQGRVTGTAAGIWAPDTYNGKVDNVSFKLIPTKDLFYTINSSTPNVIAQVTIHTNSPINGQQAGIVLNLDSESNPQNFVIAYFDGKGNIQVDKCVAGTYTAGTPTSKALAQDKVMIVVHDNAINEYRVFYDNTLITSSTITDAGITNNTLCGVFSTSTNYSFGNYVLWARGNEGQYSQLDTLK